MNRLCDMYRSIVIVGAVRTHENKPLDDDIKRRVYDYLAKPSATGWSVISGIIIDRRMLTLWQAVRKVDPSFPATGRRYEVETGRVVKEWARIPHPDLVLKGLEYARNQVRPPAA